MSGLQTALCLAAILGAVAVVPAHGGVSATENDRTEVRTGVVCSGGLDVKINRVDGRAVNPTDWVGFGDGPTSSTFSFTHTLSLRNYGTSAVRGLALITVPGRRDNSAFAAVVQVRVETSVDGFRTSVSLGPLTLAALERSPLRAVPLQAAMSRDHDLQIRITFSVAGLDNSVATATVAPTLTFVTRS